jgi:hypothetical protein
MRVKLKKSFALALLALAMCASARADFFGPWTVNLDVPRGGFPPTFADTPPYNGTSLGGPGGLDSVLQSYTLTLTFQDTGVSTISGALTLSQLDGTPSQSIDLSSGFTSSDGLTFSETFDNSSALAGYDPNTEWTLDLYDSRDAGPENTLQSWQLTITAVPEPSAGALGILGGAFLAVRSCRREWARKLLRRMPRSVA